FFLSVRRATISINDAPAAAEMAAHAPPPGVGLSEARSSRYVPTRVPAVGSCSIGTFAGGPDAAGFGVAQLPEERSRTSSVASPAGRGASPCAGGGVDPSF